MIFGRKQTCTSRGRKVSHCVCLMWLLRSPTHVLALAGVDEREKVKALFGCSRAKVPVCFSFMIHSKFTFNTLNHFLKIPQSSPVIHLSSATGMACIKETEPSLTSVDFQIMGWRKEQ